MWFCHKNSTSSHKKAAAASYALIYLFLGILARRRRSCRNCSATKIQDVIFANFSPTLSSPLLVCGVSPGCGPPCVATQPPSHTTQGVFTCKCLHSSHQQHKYLHHGPLLVQHYTLHCTDTRHSSQAHYPHV